MAIKIGDHWKHSEFDHQFTETFDEGFNSEGRKEWLKRTLEIAEKNFFWIDNETRTRPQA